jgi:transcriptional regulator with XRE-family HTH domain
MEPDRKFWSQEIRKLRLEEGMSERELARLANVNRMTLRAIENGRSPIPIDVLERLLAVLGYDLVPIKREISQGGPQAGIDRGRSGTAEGDRGGDSRSDEC